MLRDTLFKMRTKPLWAEKTMRLDQNPVFRKVIVPWYDSETACLVLIILMTLVFLFGFAGLSISQEDPRFMPYLWVPALLMLMSAGVVVSITVRLLKRYLQRYAR